MTAAVIRLLQRAALVGLALAVPGCGLLAPARSPAPSRFALQPSLVADPGAASGVTTIAIVRPAARAGFDGPGMAYVTRPYELAYFARHQWVEPPARMLAPLLAAALEGTGRLRAVGRRDGAAAQLRLETEIVALQQEFTVRPSRLRFALRAQLVDVATQRIVGTTELEAAEPAPSDDPYGGVVAANQAVARVLAELAAWCAARAPFEGAPR
jgi:cholesterol transport system auxiliary component